MIRTAAFLVLATAMSVAQADAPEHFAPTELGVIYHPNARGPGLSRSQVASDLATAQRRPDWEYLAKTGERRAPAVGAKTRAQVLQELRAAQAQPGWDIYSRTGFNYPAPPRVDRVSGGSGR